MESQTTGKSSAPKKKKTGKIILIVLAVIIFALVGINEFAKLDGIKKAEEKLNNRLSYANQIPILDTFPDPTTFMDKENGLKYEFYGVNGDMIFNEDGTVTFKRCYNRNSCFGGGAKWTDYVETTESYKVAFSGVFYPLADVGIRTESGDFYRFSFERYDFQEMVDDIYLLPDRVYSAPEELKDIETETVYKEKKYSSGGSSSSSSSDDDCPVCNGSGYVKYNYGSSDLEAALSGHDAYTVGPCPSCS